MNGEAQHCLVISDGRRGIENQALGLAEACSRLRPLMIETHHIKHGPFLSSIIPEAQSRFAKFKLPSCDIAIGCGRQAIAPLLFLKRKCPDVMTVYVQDPRINPQRFDLVIAPEHDAVRGKNVELMIGSPNRVTLPNLDEARVSFSDRLSILPQPRALFLIGGNSKAHKLEKRVHDRHISTARQLIAAGHSLLITTSRRTPDFAIAEWEKFASSTGKVWLHDGRGPNPYFAFLAHADNIFVTEDSTNMLTEACATGKPVYRLPMAGRAGKFATLYKALEKRCGVALYDGQAPGQNYTPLDETARIAQRLWMRLDQRG